EVFHLRSEYIKAGTQAGLGYEQTAREFVGFLLDGVFSTAVVFGPAGEIRQGGEAGRLWQVAMEEVVGEFVGDREAEALQFPVRPSLHEFVLLGVEVDAGEIGFDGSLDAVFGAQIVERDWVQGEVQLKEGEDVNRCLI